MNWINRIYSFCTNFRKLAASKTAYIKIHHIYATNLQRNAYILAIRLFYTPVVYESE